MAISHANLRSVAVQPGAREEAAVREAATAALKKIDPAAATKAGVN
jgi:hypothetical protein